MIPTVYSSASRQTDLAGPLARLIVQLPGSHHHGLADYLSNLLLWKVFILLLGRGRSRWWDFTLGQGGLGWCLLIAYLEKTSHQVEKQP